MDAEKKGYRLDQYLLSKALRLRKEIAISRKHKQVNKTKEPLPSHVTEGTSNLEKN